MSCASPRNSATSSGVREGTDSSFTATGLPRHLPLYIRPKAPCPTSCPSCSEEYLISVSADGRRASAAAAAKRLLAAACAAATCRGMAALLAP